MPSPAVRDAVEALASEIRAAEPTIGNADPFGPGVFKGCGPEPKVLFGDSGEIPFLAEASCNRLDYRLGFLAGEGDLVVIGDTRYPVFERYQQQVLGLSRLDFINVATQFRGRYRATPATCLRDEAAYQRLRDFAGMHGGATLFAYLTTGTVWALAARLAADTGRRIGVAGPPPLLSRRANDKIWFGEIATRLFGASSVPEKRTAHGWAALVRHVRDLAQRWERLVIKVPDSAGSAGNCAVDCAAVRGLGAKDLFGRLRSLVPPHLRGVPFPVAVEVWDVNVLTSPSVQAWIPDPKDGEPVIEGIFEQILVGAEGEFAGAVVADLPEDQDALLAEQAFALSLVFQRLGYFGRCSFDAVVSGTCPGDAQVHWIECNARWGGVSIPMSFANNSGRTAAIAIIQCRQAPAAPRQIEDALADACATAAPGSEVVLLSPNAVEAGTGCHFMTFGETPRSALHRARQVLHRLQGDG
ncbi:MAG: hypothetical protein Kow0026_16220 [Oricola sp.]